MSANSQVYISLLHGRNTSTEDMDEMGFPGPIIGPVHASFTYGNIKLHDTRGTGWGSFEFLPTVDGCIAYDGKFYGDFEVLTEGDDCLAAARTRKIDREIHNFDRFTAVLRQPVKAPTT